VETVTTVTSLGQEIPSDEHPKKVAEGKSPS
jgi:hypothetical protein